MPHLKQTVFVTLLSSILVSPISYAEQYYQTEIVANYEKEDADTSAIKIIGLGAEIYFTPVNTEKKPLEKAAFLDKKSSVFTGYIHSKVDIQNSSLDWFELDGALIGVNYKTETDAFILAAFYTKLDGESNPDQVTVDSKTLGFTIGKYISDSTTVEASYNNAEAEYLNASSSQISYLDNDYYGLTYNTVQMLGTTNNYSFGIGFQLTSIDSSTSAKEDNNEFNVSGGYYLTHMTSLDMAASFNSGDDISNKVQALAIGLTHFMAPQITIKIGLSKFNADDSNTEDTDSIAIDIVARI